MKNWLSREWVTVAFSPLPIGWFHIIQISTDNGDVLCYEPCPGVLLQECRSETYDGTHENLESPYETRLVYADSELSEAIDTDGYRGTRFNPTQQMTYWDDDI